MSSYVGLAAKIRAERGQPQCATYLWWIRHSRPHGVARLCRLGASLSLVKRGIAKCSSRRVDSAPFSSRQQPFESFHRPVTKRSTVVSREGVSVGRLPRKLADIATAEKKATGNQRGEGRKAKYAKRSRNNRSGLLFAHQTY